MRKYIGIALIVGIVLTALLFRGRPSAHTGFDLFENVLSPETKRILDTGERFVLLSIDPTLEDFRGKSDPPPNETFHEYAVLGKVEIRDQNERAGLLRALHKGIADAEGHAYNCFKPRHGIRATLGTESVDLLICFECLSIKTFTNSTGGQNVLTSRSPEPTFSRAVEKAKLAVAKER